MPYAVWLEKVHFLLRFDPVQETFLIVQPGSLKLTGIARTIAISVAASAQRFGSAVGGAGAFVHTRGSPVTAGPGGQAARPVLLAQYAPPGSARAQIVA